MQLKPFEAGRYDEETIVICNPDNGKQELFSEEQFEIVKFLKQNEDETLLALLLPNIGIAKKHHILICMRVLAKLKRMQIIDHFAITGQAPTSDTTTLEIVVEKSKLEVPSLGALAAVLLGISEKTFGRLGGPGVLLFFFLLATLSFVFFPFAAVEPALSVGGMAYWRGLGLGYIGVVGGFITRSLAQGAFVRGLGQEAQRPYFSLYFPFIGLELDRRAVNLEGFRARLQMNFLGLFSPLAFSAIFTLGAITGLISIPAAFWGFSGCVLATLLLACPFFSFDLADILHVFFLRDELKERIAIGLRHIFQAKGSLSREMLYGLLATFVWLLAWLDCIRSFWEVIASQVVSDLFTPIAIFDRIGASFVTAGLISMLFLPVVIFVGAFARDRFSGRRKRVVLKNNEVKESLSFEERMAALEKIPLFSYLKDSERLALINEMNPAFFEHNNYLVRQGEVGNEFFVLVKGQANATFTDVQGRTHHLADLQEGDAFGEIALIDDVPRTASIISDGGCIVLSLSKAGFDHFAETLGSPDRVKAMIRLTSFFRRHPLFSKLNAKDQAQLIDTFRFDTITAGEEIPENDESFRVLYSGKVRVDTGDDAADTMLHADDCFGYANGLNARYFAQEGTGLLSVKRSEFHNLIWEKLVEKPELFV